MNPGRKMIGDAKQRAAMTWPYAAHAILTMIPVERRGLQTVHADKFMRLYYDPEAFQTLYDLSVRVIEQVTHMLLRHGVRGEQLCGDNEQRLECWRLAAKLAVHEVMRKEDITWDEQDQPGHEPMLNPKDLDLQPNQSAETYFKELWKRHEDNAQQQQQSPSLQQDEQEGQGQGSGDAQEDAEGAEGNQEEGQNQGDGDNEDGRDGAGDGLGESPDSDSQQESSMDSNAPPCGSVVDGQKKDWEEDNPGEEEGAGGKEGSGSESSSHQHGRGKDPIPGVEEHEQEVIRDQCLQAMESRGVNPGGMKDFIDQILHPKVDPRRLLMMAITSKLQNINSSSSGDRYSYRRPHRRPSLSKGMIRPRGFRVTPKVLVIIDVSGSMSREEMALGVGLVAKTLNTMNLRDGIRVIAGDTYAAFDQNVVDASKIEIVGRGGTDMGKIIEEACDKTNNKPDQLPELVLVCTDGETPWPSQRVEPPVVACLTRRPRYCAPPPEWIRAIYL